MPHKLLELLYELGRVLTFEIFDVVVDIGKHDSFVDIAGLVQHQVEDFAAL